MAGGKPVPLWIMQTIRVQFMPPSYIDLAEIVCPTREIADSLYARLKSGEDFVTLARTCSRGPTKDQGGILGEVDVRTYPMEVQQVLRKLQEGMITEPLEIGTQFVIFKRLSRVTPSFGNI
jgi:parvulin-like peptidyl-prolyl isomerase